jgi:hypothetical protein
MEEVFAFIFGLLFGSLLNIDLAALFADLGNLFGSMT